MVANEVTSSVQKKSVTRVAVAVAAGLISAASLSANAAEHDFSTSTSPVDISNLQMQGTSSQFIFSSPSNKGTLDISGKNLNWNSGYKGQYIEGNIIGAWGLKSMSLESLILSGNKITASDVSSDYEFTYGAIVLRDQISNNDKDNAHGDSFSLKNFTITGNSATISRHNSDNNKASSAAGGVFSIWDVDTVEFTNGIASDNHVSITGDAAAESDYAASARGGFLEIKRGNTTFTDVIFTNNTAETVGGKSLAAGGALYIDGMEGTNGVGNTQDPCKVTFKVTKDAIYSGNNVSGGDNKFHDSWGHMAQSGGGFLYLDRGAKAEFNISGGATLTIGEENATGEMDSIASSFAVNTYTKANGETQSPVNKTSEISKTGEGTLILNGNLEKYYGTVTVSAGEMQVNKDWTIHNDVTVNGGTLNTKAIVLDKVPTIAANGAYDPQAESSINSELTPVGNPLGKITISSGELNATSITFNGADNQVSVTGGSLVVGTLDLTKGGKVEVNGGTLQTASSQVYTVSEGVTLIAEDASTVTKDFNGKSVSKKDAFTFTSGTLALTDSGFYTAASLKEMSDAAKGMTVTLANASLAAGEKSELADNVVQNNQSVEVSGTTTNGEASIAVKDSGAQSLIVAPTTEGQAVTSVKLSAKDGGKTITLVGTTDASANKQLVTDKSTGNALAVTVDSNLQLNLGTEESASETYGSLTDLTLTAGENTTSAAKLAVVNTSVELNKLDAQGNNTITIGSNLNRGFLSVKELILKAGSVIFLDPAWEDGQPIASIAKASHLEVANLSTLKGKLIAGENSLITLGSTTQNAIAAFESLEDHAWGSGHITAALYLGKALKFDAETNNGLIVVNGSLKTLPTSTNVTDNVNLAANSLLMVDQKAVGSKAIDGLLSIADSAKVALVNATGEDITLATTVSDTSTLTKDQIVTDNVFVTVDDVKNGTVSTSVNSKSLAGAFSSMGLQAMTRRADTMLATSIADRTSLDQTMGEGVSLWVDVAGERYEADDLDNNGEFHSDMGYGTFGGDVQIADGARLGAAIQYGSGSARSDNLGMKNEIDSYGISLYGSYAWGDAKVVGELAYVKNENDITADAIAKLNQSVDTDIFSAGVRAQYALNAGVFKFVPSIGVRVSQLSSDEVKAGALRFGDDDLTLVQVPLSIRISGYDVNADGWQLSPSFKLSYVPTFGDKDIDVYGVDQTVIDTNPVQGDVGLRATNGNMMFNANFMFGAGKDGTSAVGGKVGMKYVF